MVNHRFQGLTETNLINNINKYDKGQLTIKNTGNKELDDLINNLLQKESSQRLNWDHPFFKNGNTNIIDLIYYVDEDDYKYYDKIDIFGEDLYK